MKLIGGQRMLELGSKRATADTDYLVYDNNMPLFYNNGENIDYINAAKNAFYAEIWDAEKENEKVSAQSMAEMKAYALVMHVRNHNFRKADEAEYDILALKHLHGVNTLKTVYKHISMGEAEEIKKLLK